MKSCSRGLGILPVATEDVSPTHPDLASLALGQPLTCLGVKDSYFYSGKRQAHTAGLLSAMQRVRGIDRRFRQSVTLDWRETEALLEATKGLRRQRRRATGEQPH